MMYIFHYRHQRINPIKVTPPPIICKIINVNFIFSSFMLKGDFFKFLLLPYTVITYYLD